MSNTEYIVCLGANVLDSDAKNIGWWLSQNIGEMNSKWSLNIPEDRLVLEIIFYTKEDKTQFVLAWGQECLTSK